MLVPVLQSYEYPNLSEGADSIGGQLHGYKDFTFSGVTNSGRVWRKVLESTDLISGQLRGDEECPFSCVTNSGRVWRQVPESDSRSVVSMWRAP